MKARRFIHTMVALLFAALLLDLLGATEPAKAASYTEWHITVSGNTFTISRDITDQEETVGYNTYSLTALDGVHFTGVCGTLTFAVGEHNKSITVQETPEENLSLADRYLLFRDREVGEVHPDLIARQYGFEVTDQEGLRMAKAVREILYSKENCAFYVDRFTNRLNDAPKDILAIDNRYGEYWTYSKFKSVDKTLIGDDYVTITDSGYGQAVFTAHLDDLYAAYGASKEYLEELGIRLNVVVGFTMREINDGYQYIQILADNDTTFDDKDPYSGVNTPSTSLYKACFELSATGSSVENDDQLMFFPHRYDYQTRAEGGPNLLFEGCTEFPTDNCKLYAQAFRDSSLRDERTGALCLPLVDKISVRFDAAGNQDDDWEVKNLFIRVGLVAAGSDPVLTDVVVAPGPKASNNLVHISLRFDKPVDMCTNLKTSWGEFSPDEDAFNPLHFGLGNVVTYSGGIDAADGTPLTIYGDNLKLWKYTGFVSAFTIPSFTRTFDMAVEPHVIEYTITYECLENCETIEPLPTSYVYSRNDIPLENPTRYGYSFQGWVGLEGSLEDREDGTTIIPRFTRGNRRIQAIWWILEWQLHTDRGVLGKGMNTLTAFDTPITFEPLSCEGYIFDGWTGTDLGDEPVQSFIIPEGVYTEPRYYLAHWTPITYNIQYDLGGGSTDNPVTCTIEDSFTLTDPVRPGYVFVGWTGTGLGNEPVQEVRISRTKTDRAYTAHWVQDTYLEQAGNGFTRATIPEGIPVLTQESTEWSGCVLAFGDVEISERVTVAGDVKLILLDNCELSVPRGITVNSGSSLTVCAQSDNGDMGRLIVTSPVNSAAGIGGGSGCSSGAIIINGGFVTANTAGDGAAIGGGAGGDGTVTVNAGRVTLTANGNGAAIGGGAGGDGTIALGWNNSFEDYVVADSYRGSVTLNKAFVVDGTIIPAGTVSEPSALDGLKLTPVILQYRNCVNDAFVTAEVPADAVILSPQSTQWSGVVIAYGQIGISERAVVSGDVTLILMDKCDLTAAKGIAVNSGSSLTICAQSTGDDMGKLTALSTSDEIGAAIGSDNSLNSGAITINGGQIKAGTTKGRAAGIGGGANGIGTFITINDGTIDAYTSTYNIGGAGIGSGDQADGGTIIIHGGNLKIKGSKGAAGIGGGRYGSGGVVTITGGYVFTRGKYTAADNGPGIGAGCAPEGAAVWDSGTITITGGTVIAIGGSTAQAIGVNNEAAGLDIGTLTLGANMKVCGSADGTEYVNESQRISACHGGEVRIECCEHNFVNGLCIWCGTGFAAFGTPDFTLPSALTVIEDNAFEGDVGITIVDAHSCSSIGAEAFRGCIGLAQIRLMQNCTIDATAFDGCGIVFVFAPAGGTTEAYCLEHDNCEFVELQN